MDDRESESSENWDFGQAEKRPGVKGARAVVPVAFTPGDFERVAEAAREAGKRTSEFIRQAALEKAFR